MVGRSLFILLTLVAACARPTSIVAPQGPALLAVVTWNTHGEAGDLPRLLTDLGAGRLPGAPVRDYVVLLQETSEDQVAALAADRAVSFYFGAVRRSPLRTSGNAIVSTLPLAGTRTIDLPRERQPRAAVAATIEVGGAQLFVISTHLENRLGWLRGLFGDRARGRQAQALLREIPPQQDGILGGDMNTMLGPDEPAWRAFLDRFPQTPPRPEPTFRDRLVLDHLFFDLPDRWTATRTVIADRYGSDHHPVLGLVHGPRF